MDKETPNRYRMNLPCDPMDLMQMAGGDWFRDFCLGSAMKYAARAGLKEGESAIKDLGKAEHYLRRYATTQGWTLAARLDPSQLPADAEEVRALAVKQIIAAYHEGHNEHAKAYYVVHAWLRREEQEAQATEMRSVKPTPIRPAGIDRPSTGTRVP